MILQYHLEEFCNQNGIPKNGGSNDNTFEFNIIGRILTLPNPMCRKRTAHIHDIEYVLFEFNTTWKGEAFIAGLEISTSMFKHLPRGFKSLWAMGYSL